MRIAAVVCVVLAAALMTTARADEGDAILGQWLTQDGKAHVEITKVNGKYDGKIVWLKEPNYPEGDKEAGKEKHDRFNPDESKRDKPILGLEMLKGFQYGKDNTWSGGTIYDPEEGKTYKCKIKLEGKTLKVRGYIGISLIGRTTEWTRLEPASEKAAQPPGTPAAK